MEQGLEASGLDGARARVEQAMRLIEQAGECLRSADAIALDIDPHYLAAAFTGKTVSLCDQLEQATKQTAAEVEEMRRQEPSVESSDGNDDSTAFFQDFLEGKKSSDCPCDAPALVDLWKHRLRSRYAESSAD